MKALETVQLFIGSLDQQRFYKYLAGVCGAIVTLAALIIFMYYSSISSLEDRIDAINRERLEVKRLMTTYQQVKLQRAQVDTLYEEDPGFRIAGYFEKVLTKLNLTAKKVMADQISHLEHEGKYEETLLKTQLTDMNTRQLCELLSELEQNKRIYTKELDVTKSKRKPKVLDVTLTIAALEPKT